MPHWYGIVTIQTPQFIKGLSGDKRAIQQAILEYAPQGVNVRTFHWFKNEPKVGVTVWGGDAAERYLRDELEAEPVDELDDTAPVSPA
jgi:hypothetical protein